MQASTLELKDSILAVARTRSDALAEAVFARVNFEHDLVAALFFPVKSNVTLFW